MRKLVTIIALIVTSNLGFSQGYLDVGVKGYFGTTEDIHRLVATHLTGKWFSNFRFIAKVYYKEYSEICWMSIDGSKSISLLVGPKNEVKIVHSSPTFYDAEIELEILVDKIAQTIEDELGLIIDITSLVVYENDEIMA